MTEDGIGLCNKNTGDCDCNEGYTGKLCDECNVGFYNDSNTCTGKYDYIQIKLLEDMENISSYPNL